MSFELEQAINEMKSVLDHWEFMAKRTDLDPENLDLNDRWTLDDCKKHYGTWIDEDGEEQICRSTAEESVAKLIRAAEKLVRDQDNERRQWHMTRDSARRRIDELEKFAGMNDRDLGLYLEEHLRRAQEYEGEETISSIPNFYWHIARRLK